MAVLASTLADWMTGPGALVPLPDVAHTLNHHRSQHATFATVCAADRAAAIAGLRAVAAGEPATGVVHPHRGACGSGTVFVYSGQGSQWAGMGRRLLADEPAFAAAVAALEPDFVEQVGFSLHDVLVSAEALSGIERIQPVVVGIQLALTALWRSHGVEPDAVIGHSMGEVTAAVVAGALTPAQGLRVIATRSRLMAVRAEKGAMALLELDAPRRRGIDRRFHRGDGRGACLPQSDCGRRADRGRRRRHRQGNSAEHVRQEGRRGSRVSPRDDGPHPGRVEGGVGVSDAEKSPGAGHQHGRECGCRNAFRRRSLGGQPAKSGPVQPGGRRRRRHPLHLHRDQPAPAAHQGDLRHPRAPFYRQRAPPLPGHAAARRSRHRRIPHQSQRHPHRPAAAR